MEEAAAEQTVWSGKLESKVIVCPACGMPAGTGKFCQNCGSSLQAKKCPGCGAAVADGMRFCGECGTKV